MTHLNGGLGLKQGQFLHHLNQLDLLARRGLPDQVVEQHKLVQWIQFSVGGPGQDLETKAVESHLSPASGSSDNGVDGSVAGESSQLLLFLC
ncbi:hypothetical protein [Synechococcus sp. N32]|uniref:hypothetical protein n=1 Tax=Synechococcus sp. N32 TaxID=2575514 RepID=UPI00148356E2|nr:hypothetical protein [Synechococcus sp. N32]